MRTSRIARAQHRVATVGVAVAVMAGAGLAAVATPTAAAAAPVGCSADMYFATANTITQRAADGTLTSVSTGALDPFTIALNPAGDLYALPNDQPNGNHLFRVEADGTPTDLGAVSGLPANVLYALGGFDADGVLWTASQTVLYRIDVGAMTATSVPLSGGLAFSDYAAIGGALYSQTGTILARQLARVDPATGVVTAVPVPGMTSATSVVAVDGHLYVTQSTTIFEVLGYDTATPTLLPVATGMPSAPRDGASCPTGPSPFLNADDDDFTATAIAASTGGTAGVVFGNDTSNGALVDPAGVTATVVTDGGLTGVSLGGDGTLTVPANATPGPYAVTYRLCAVATPTLCDTAVATVLIASPAVVTPPPVLAATGSDAGGSLWAAALLILGGGGIVALRRRTARS